MWTLDDAEKFSFNFLQQQQQKNRTTTSTGMSATTIVQLIITGRKGSAAQWGSHLWLGGCGFNSSPGSSCHVPQLFLLFFIWSYLFVCSGTDDKKFPVQFACSPCVFVGSLLFSYSNDQCKKYEKRDIKNDSVNLEWLEKRKKATAVPTLPSVLSLLLLQERHQTWQHLTAGCVCSHLAP